MSIQRLIIHWNCFCHGSVVFRKEPILFVGGYRRAVGESEDYDLWLRVSEHYETANLDKILYQWRFCSSSTKVKKILKRSFDASIARQCARERIQRGHDFFMGTKHNKIDLYQATRIVITNRVFIARSCRYWGVRLARGSNYLRGVILIFMSILFAPLVCFGDLIGKGVNLFRRPS